MAPTNFSVSVASSISSTADLKECTRVNPQMPYSVGCGALKRF
jgi:hypothetical protein